MCWRVPSARSHLRIAWGSCCTPWRPPKLQWGTHLCFVRASVRLVHAAWDCLQTAWVWKNGRKNAGDYRNELPGIQDSCTQSLDALSQRLFAQIIICVEEFGTVSRFLCHHARCGWEHTASVLRKRAACVILLMEEDFGLPAALSDWQQTGWVQRSGTAHW